MPEIVPMKITIEFTIETEDGETAGELQEEVENALETPIHMIGGQEISYTVELA